MVDDWLLIDKNVGDWRNGWRLHISCLATCGMRQKHTGGEESKDCYGVKKLYVYVHVGFWICVCTTS